MKQAQKATSLTPTIHINSIFQCLPLDPLLVGISSICPDNSNCGQQFYYHHSVNEWVLNTHRSLGNIGPPWNPSKSLNATICWSLTSMFMETAKDKSWWPFEKNYICIDFVSQLRTYIHLFNVNNLFYFGDETTGCQALLTVWSRMLTTGWCGRHEPAALPATCVFNISLCVLCERWGGGG